MRTKERERFSKKEKTEKGKTKGACGMAQCKKKSLPYRHPLSAECMQIVPASSLVDFLRHYIMSGVCVCVFVKAKRRKE